MVSKQELEEVPSKKGLMTIRTFCSQFSWPSEGAIRAYIFKAEELGLLEAFVRVKRRVLIDVEKFFLLIVNVNKTTKDGVNYETNHSETKGAPRF